MAGTDLYVVANATDTNVALRVFSFGGRRSVSMTGFYKTILQWTKCLLTEIGSDISDPTYGTSLAAHIGNNYTTTQAMHELVVTSIQEATRQIKLRQRASDPSLEEQLASVVITKLEVSPTTGVDVYVTISNAAGKSLQFSVPVGTALPRATPK